MNRSKTTRSTRWFLALGLLPIFAAGCGDSPTDTSLQSGANVSVYLKDAPGDVDSVWVQIDDIVLMGDSGTVSVLDAPTGLINVTSLQDSTSLLIDGHEVPVGHYSEVRFVLGGAVLQAGEDVYTFGGAEHPGGLAATGTLQCPSCAQSGIKVKLSDGMDFEEGENALLLDFDVSQSFGHQAGKSGKWVMHPVIHGAEAEVGEAENDDVGGKIEGTVSLGNDVNGNPLTIPMCGGSARTLASFVPTATAMTLTDADGAALMFAGHTEHEDEGSTFEIETIDFDTFTLGFEAHTDFDTERLVWTAAVDPATVTLDATNAKAEGVSYTVTGVTCEAITP